MPSLLYELTEDVLGPDNKYANIDLCQNKVMAYHIVVTLHCCRAVRNDPGFSPQEPEAIRRPALQKAASRIFPREGRVILDF